MTKTTNVPAIDATVTANTLTLKFSNGNSLTLHDTDVPEHIRVVAMMHGFKQKLVDAAAISRNTETGRAASVDDKFAAVKKIYDRLIGGDWNKVSEGGAGASGGLLFRALCRMYEGKKTAEAIRVYLTDRTDAEKAALRKNSKIAAVIEQIRAESARTDGISGDDLLAELDD